MTRAIRFGEWIVTQIQILRDRGTDKICFTLAQAPTPFPELAAQEPAGDYAPYFTIEVRRGYAEQWLKLTFDLELPDQRVTLLDTGKKS